MNRFSHVAFLLVAGCLLSAGCGRTPPASYRLNMVEATKQRLTPDQERQVATVLLAKPSMSFLRATLIQLRSPLGIWLPQALKLLLTILWRLLNKILAT